jgi:hypothetical protein
MMHGHFGAPHYLIALGLSLLVFKPKWQALTRFRSLTISIVAAMVLIAGLLGLAGIFRVWRIST